MIDGRVRRRTRLSTVRPTVRRVRPAQLTTASGVRVACASLASPTVRKQMNMTLPLLVDQHRHFEMLKIRQEEGPFSTLRVAAAKRRVETTESKQSRHTHTHTQEALGGYLPTREGGRRKYTVKRRQFPGSRQVGWAIPLKTSHESVSSEWGSLKRTKAKPNSSSLTFR